MVWNNIKRITNFLEVNLSSFIRIFFGILMACAPLLFNSEGWYQMFCLVVILLNDVKSRTTGRRHTEYYYFPLKSSGVKGSINPKF